MMKVNTAFQFLKEELDNNEHILLLLADETSKIDIIQIEKKFEKKYSILS